MCNTPVTFGGGITIENGGLSLLLSALKNSLSSQNLYISASVLWASYTVANSSAMLIFYSFYFASFFLFKVNTKVIT